MKNDDSILGETSGVITDEFSSKAAHVRLFEGYESYKDRISTISPAEMFNAGGVDLTKPLEYEDWVAAKFPVPAIGKFLMKL